MIVALPQLRIYQDTMQNRIFNTVSIFKCEINHVSAFNKKTSRRIVDSCTRTGAIKTSEIRSLPPAWADLATVPWVSPDTANTDIFIWPEPRGAAASSQCLTPVNCGCSYIYIYIYIPAPAIINPSVHTADIAMSAWWPVPAASRAQHTTF